MRNIMRNTGLEEAQAGIKIAGRNIHNLRYVDDATLMPGDQHFSIMFESHLKQQNHQQNAKKCQKHVAN